MDWSHAFGFFIGAFLANVVFYAVFRRAWWDSKD